MNENPIHLILKQFRQEIAVIAFFSMVTNVLMLTPTIYLLQVFDRVMISQSGLTLIAVSFIALLCFAVMGFSDWCRSRLLVRAGFRFDLLLNSRVFHSSFKAALNRGVANPGQGLMDLVNLRQFLTGSGVFAFFDLPWIPIYIIVSWLLHPFLGVLTIGFLILLALAAVLSQWMIREEHEVHLDATNKASVFLQAKTRNAELITSMGMTGNLFQRWRVLYGEQTFYSSRLQDHSQRAQAVVKFLQYTQQSMVLGAGAILVIQGELSVGGMIAASVLATRALQPVQSIVTTWRGVMVARLSYQRLNKSLLDFPDTPQLVFNGLVEGVLVCRKLTAWAGEKRITILNAIDLKFEPGKLTVILGPSGSGKSTLARCLLGIWASTEGEVLLDEVPIKRLDREVLGPSIGYLPQEVELFEGSIAENIARFGKIDSNKVIAAAKTAGVHDMILRFPYGYDSQIGVAGSLLSGGQLQRIGLARAIYDNPKIIVLDEPNSNLDDLGEAALLNAVIDLKNSGKTVILISHRTGIVNAADQLLVLERGKVSSFGSRADVLQQMKSAKLVAVQDQ